LGIIGGSFLDSNILVQVINLARRPDRLARITNDLHRAGINFEIQVAIDGHLEDNNSPVLSRGEVGCWKSHVNAMRRIEETGAQYSLILEDDAKLEFKVSPDFLSKMIKLMTVHNIDLLQIGHISQWYDVPIKAGILKYLNAYLRNRGKRDESGFRFVFGDFRAGTHAYIVNARLAKAICLTAAEPSIRPWDGYLNSVAIGKAGLDARVARLRTSVVSQVSRQPDSIEIDSDIASE
jgi:GR25 family glycosyltransferase involved in LPS biosynthesis